MRSILFTLCVFLCLCGVAVAASNGDPRVEELAQTGRSWDGTALPAYPQGEPEITILHITIPPKHKLAWHKHPVINAGYLLAGELTVTTSAEETLQLTAGEAIVEVVDKWHYGENTGEEAAEIVVFYAGTQDAPITVTK